MSNDFKQCITGFRGKSKRGSKGGPCPCCVETSSKPGRSRMARARLAQSDRDVISDGIEACGDAQQEGGDFAPYVEDIEL
jgi:hypothetical protein